MQPVIGNLHMESPAIPWTTQFSKGACRCLSGAGASLCCWRGDGRWEKRPVPPIVLECTQPPSIHRRCYLSGFGSCSQKITKEHFISRTILERLAPLRFENAGHFFGGRQSVEVSVDSFSAKVLCDEHNNALSPLDTAAGLTFKTVEALTSDLIAISNRTRRLESFYLTSGIDMERWLIKVFCGLVAAGKIRSQSGRSIGIDALSKDLLQSMLGYASLVSPLGMYMSIYPGQRLNPDGLSFSTLKLMDGSDDVGGLMLSLGVLDFILVTSPHYGQTFSNAQWTRHHWMPWSVEQNNSKLGYVLTY